MIQKTRNRTRNEFRNKPRKIPGSAALSLESDSCSAQHSHPSPFFLLIIFSASILLGGCSGVSFSQSSHTPATTTLSDEATPLSTAPSLETEPSLHRVQYPSKAKVDHFPYVYGTGEILTNPQVDDKTCSITAWVTPLVPNLCQTVPDLCFIVPLATVTRLEDYTCRQAFRAESLRNRNANIDDSITPCIESTRALTQQEMSQIQDHQRYQIISTFDFDVANFNPGKAEVVLPELNGIRLDSHCRCNYVSSNNPSFLYEYPAMEAHCRNHFEVYRQ